MCTAKYSPRGPTDGLVPVCRVRAVGGVPRRGGRGSDPRVGPAGDAGVDRDRSQRAIGAGRYERTETRVNDRNGSRPRLLATQAGDVELRIPKLRKGSFFPTILEPRRRIDQALYAVVMEAYVNGVSTRAVDDLVAAMGIDSGISKSEVSRICAGLDEVVDAFRTRPLDHTRFPYVSSTRPTCTCRNAPRAGGVDGGGRRYRRHRRRRPGGPRARRRRLRGRGVLAGFLTAEDARPGGVRLVISDQHAGLVAALQPSFQGAAHQRCRVHFARNLLALVPKSHKDMVAAVFRTIFAQPDADAVAATWDQVRDQLAAPFPKIGPLMDQAKAEVLAFTAFPRAHWPKIWCTNPLERVNKEIKRRARVVGIFLCVPLGAGGLPGSAARLVEVPRTTRNLSVDRHRC